MSQLTARGAADLDWADKAAHLSVDALVAGKALLPEQHERAVEIMMHEIYDLLTIEDRPIK